MSYLTLSQMKAALPAEITDQLLDDNGAGVGDAAVWTEIVNTVTQEIDAKVGQRYTLPISDAQALKLLGDYAFVLAAELLYQRKGFFAAANPWTARAQSVRGTQGQQGGQPGALDNIADGSSPLVPNAPRRSTPAAAITETTKLVSSQGNNLC